MLRLRAHVAALLALGVATAGLVVGGLSGRAGAACDEPREVFVLDTAADEGNPSRAGNRTVFAFPVLSQGCAQEGQVDYEIVSLTTGRDDLVYGSGRLVFKEGDESAQKLEVTVFADENREPDEYFLVKLSEGSGRLTVCNLTALGTVRDDDVSSDHPPAGAKPLFSAPPQRCELHSSR